MARRLQLRPGVGELLLTSKLQILNGTGNRRPSRALAMLTGRVVDPFLLVADVEQRSGGPDGETASFPTPLPLASHRHGRQYAARTVYLSERHLHDVDRIVEAWQRVDSRRVTRSAVLRRAIDYLRDAVEADPANCTLEND